MSSPARITLTFTLGGQARRVAVAQDAVLGREPDCDVVLMHRSVSRHHARLVFTDAGWQVVDLGSANGTFINGAKVQRARLLEGDVLKLGQLELSCDRPSSKATFAPQFTPPPSEDLGAGMHTMAAPLGDLDGRLDSVLSAKAEPTRQGLPAEGRYPSAAARLVHMLKDATEALLEGEGFDATLERVMDLVFEHLPAERGFLQLCDEETGELVPRLERPLREGKSPASISTHVAELVVQERKAVRIEDSEQDERFATAKSLIGIRSALCVPLEHEDRVAGLIYVDSQSLAGFGGTDLDVLVILAKLAGAAVERDRMRARIVRERRIRARLSRYHAPSVVDHIVAREEAAGMVAEEREVSVLFCDLVGFTSMAERMDPSSVVSLLSEVFECLTDEVFEAGGTLDKFIGDAVMAFFGAPIAQPDHAARAVRAAVAMQGRMQQLNHMRPEFGGLALRVGINTGPAVVGDVGAQRRMDYTVIGDTVNVASRLESSVAQAGDVVIGPTTRAQLRGAFDLEALKPIPLRNRREPIQPYRVV